MRHLYLKLPWRDATECFPPRDANFLPERKISGSLRQRAMHSGQHFARRNGRQAFLLLFDANLQIASPAVGAVVDHLMMFAPGKPCSRSIPRREHDHAGCSDGGSQMHGATVMPEEQPGARHYGGGFPRCDAAAQVDGTANPGRGREFADGVFFVGPNENQAVLG